MATTIDTGGQGLAELIAIARAAHLTHDREMKSAAVRRLREEHGVNITFARATSPKREGVPCK